MARRTAPPAAMTQREGLPPSPFAAPAVRRAEWRRAAVAASMLATVLAEAVAVWVFDWLVLWVWLAVVAVQYGALVRANKDVAAARKRALDAYFAGLDARYRRR